MNKRTLHALAFLASLQGFCQENTVKDSIPNVKEIQEVIIKSQKRKVFSDHVSYSFDEKAIKSARYAKDLVVSVPQLQLDPVSNNVSSIRGGKILILINGRESTNLQLQGIKPETVVRIDYYDVPPTRWANKADLVVNVITRNPENGYTGGASVQNATFTGFVNGSAYFTHTRGKNTFGLDYNLGFRDYDNRNYHSTYEYLLNGQKYRSDEFRKEHFGYTIQEISATYSNSKEDSYSFQAKLNLNMNHYFSKANGESEFIQGALTTQNSLLNSDNEKYINPVLDLYFNKNLGQKDEIALNAVGSFFRTQNSKLAKEWVTNTGASVFENDMSLSNRQFNSVVELAHIHTFKIGKLNSGYRFSNENISNNLTNLAGHSEYQVNYFKQYFYTEFSGKIIGYDIDPSAVKAARTNVESIEMEDIIEIRKQNFFESKKELFPLMVMFNPPYDKRISIQEEDFYKKIGDTFKQNYPNTLSWIITSDLEAVKKIGLRPSRKVKLFNGKLECRFLQYETYEGTKKTHKFSNEKDSN